MLSTIAITPEVFQEAAYTHSKTSRLYLQSLKDSVLHEVLVRNLHGGDWYREVAASLGSFTPMARELVRKMHSLNRLAMTATCNVPVPDSDQLWCHEAIEGHELNSLECVIASPETKRLYSEHGIVADIERLTSHPWWQNRSPSVSLERTTCEYLLRLEVVLSHANSIMFIDPHLDPSKPSYCEFFELLLKCDRPSPQPLIEIHRVCYTGSGRAREVVAREEWEKRFRAELESKISHSSLKVEVLIWDDFHDRSLISDLIGISLPNGFDIDNSKNNKTKWLRYGRKHRDDIQREFDPSSGQHTLRHRFTLND